MSCRSCGYSSDVYRLLVADMILRIKREVRGSQGKSGEVRG